MSPGRPLSDCTLSFLHVSQAVVICRREFPASRFTSPNAHKRSLAARCLIHYLRGKTDHLATSRVSLGSKSPLSHNPLGKIPIAAHIQTKFDSRRHAENGMWGYSNFRLVIVYLSVISQGVVVEYPDLKITCGVLFSKGPMCNFFKAQS